MLVTLHSYRALLDTVIQLILISVNLTDNKITSGFIVSAPFKIAKSRSVLAFREHDAAMLTPKHLAKSTSPFRTNSVAL